MTLRGWLAVAVVLLLGGAAGSVGRTALATDAEVAYTGTIPSDQFTSLRQSLDTTSGELEIARLKLTRAEALLDYSARYQIPADLAGLIYDTALREGIDPELAFGLVKVESGFVARAVSSAGALGLAQVQLATARFYQPSIAAEDLFDPATNLRIGFRYLHDLLVIYGDVKLALLAYNRGPGRLNELIDQGRDPNNGYWSWVLEGYSGM